MRRVHHDHPGGRFDGRLKFSRVERVVGGPQCDRPAHTTGQLDHCRIQVEVGLEDDDLLTGFDEGHDGRSQGLGRPGGHNDVVGIDMLVVETGLVVGYCLTQLGYAAVWRILVEAVADGLDSRRGHFGRTVSIGEALPEVDGTSLDGQRRHLAEDRESMALHPGHQMRVRRHGHSGHSTGYRSRSFLAITIFWISLVPSPMIISGVSRKYRSTGNSVV